MLSRIIAFTLIMSVPAFAADECDPQIVDPNVLRDLTRVSSRMNMECPNQLNVAAFCSAVDAQILEDNPSHPNILYKYQSMIYNASCVEKNDGDEAIRSKVQNFWNRYHSNLTCTTPNFVPSNGNILKLAVARQSGTFIDDALESWKVNLNHVDNIDHATVLDYIESRKTQAGANSPFGRALQRYYDRFRAAGAKYSREL